MLTTTIVTAIASGDHRAPGEPHRFPAAGCVPEVGVLFQSLQVGANLRRLLVTRFAVRLQAPRDDRLQRRRLLEAQLDGCDGARAFRHFIEHQAECPDVGAVIDRFTASLLRRHVCRGAQDHAPPGRAAGQRRRIVVVRSRALHLGQTEVQDLRVAATADEDVRRLDVAVDDAGVVRGVERIGDFDAERQHRVQRQAAALGDSLLQRDAFQVLHDDEGAAVLLADVVNRADVGVVQRRRGSGLAAEAIQRVRVAQPVRPTGTSARPSRWSRSSCAL